MRVAELTDLLDRSTRLLQGRSPDVRDIVEKPERLGRFPDSWRDISEVYASCQIDCIETVVSSLTQSIEACSFDTSDMVVLICGSLARLEYIPGLSDFDFTVILRDDAGKWTESEEPKVMERFEKTLRTQIRKRVGAMEKRLKRRFPDFPFPVRTGAAIDVDVDSIPWGGQRFFIRERDLFRFIGKDYEGTYAPYIRSHLLQENVFLAGDEEFHAELQKTAEDRYKVSSDVGEEAFPSLCYSFLMSLMWSGIVAKASHIRTYKDVSVDHLVGKTLLGRVWVSKLNALALHMLYWNHVILGEGSVVPKDVLETLQTPTLAKVVYLLPDLHRKLDGGFLSWISQYPGPEQDDVLKSIWLPWKKFGSFFSVDPETGSPTSTPDPDIVLTQYFRRLVSICLGVRLEKEKKGAFGPRQVRLVRAANHCLSEILETAQKITEAMIRADSVTAIRPGYARFRAMMPQDVLPG